MSSLYFEEKAARSESLPFASSFMQTAYDLDQLKVDLFHSSQNHLEAHFCMFSRALMVFFVCGDHTGQQFSRCGLTSACGVCSGPKHLCYNHVRIDVEGLGFGGFPFYMVDVVFSWKFTVDHYTKVRERVNQGAQGVD